MAEDEVGSAQEGGDRGQATPWLLSRGGMVSGQAVGSRVRDLGPVGGGGERAEVEGVEGEEEGLRAEPELPGPRRMRGHRLGGGRAMERASLGSFADSAKCEILVALSRRRLAPPLYSRIGFNGTPEIFCLSEKLTSRVGFRTGNDRLGIG